MALLDARLVLYMCVCTLAEHILHGSCSHNERPRQCHVHSAGGVGGAGRRRSTLPPLLPPLCSQIRMSQVLLLLVYTLVHSSYTTLSDVQ